MKNLRTNSTESRVCPICSFVVPSECFSLHISLHLPIVMKMMALQTSDNASQESCEKFVAELLLLVENRSKLSGNLAVGTENFEKPRSQRGRPATPASNSNASPMKQLRRIGEKSAVQFTQPLRQMKCALCGFQSFARSFISAHVWSKHVLPKGGGGKKRAQFYRCHLCNKFVRHTYSHFSVIHGSGKAVDVDGNFDDLRSQFADEYRSAFAKCYPDEDERALQKFSIAEITKLRKKMGQQKLRIQFRQAKQADN